MRLSIAVATLLMTALPCSAVAQSLEPGARVRVLTDEGAVIGMIEDLSPSLLSLRTGRNSLRQMPRKEVERLELSVGQERDFGRVFYATVGGGMAMGGIMGALSYSPCEPNGFLSCLMAPESRAGAFGMGVAVGGLLALPLGMILGATSRRDVWEPLELPAGSFASISVLPIVGSRAGVSGSISFGRR